MPIRAVKQSEMDELNDLLEASYKGAEKDHRFKKLYKEKPLIEPWGRVYEFIPEVDNSLKLNEKIESKKFIAFCGIYPQKIQYGHSVLLNAGIRNVATHPVARGNKIGLELLKNVRDFCFNQEADFSILFSGANHFYEKNGWRGGLQESSYFLPSKDIKSFINKNYEKDSVDLYSDFDINKWEISSLNEDDIPLISELYSSSNEGLYFVALRDEDFWKRHLRTRPEMKWFYHLIKDNKDGKAVAYFNVAFKEIQNKKNLSNSNVNTSSLNGRRIEIQINEMRFAPSIAKIGSPQLSGAFKIFLKYIIEEGLESIEDLVGIRFYQSIYNPLIKHIYHEKMSITFQPNILLGNMILITNPYSLFNKLSKEFHVRYEQGRFPIGIFALQFDKSGKFPGGIIIDTRRYNYSQKVYDNNKEFYERIENESGITLFVSRNISDLTLIFADILESEDLESVQSLNHLSPAIDPSSTFSVSTEPMYYFENDAIEWINAMFGEITYEFAKLDHY